ncbi:hypothetical protein [Burkholderia ubonensis]|uniref:hypothetical protein n=1 Tax=Burkholderia ubonensis TaxID=101571 RepID=UPI0012F78C15|nr:hypothetical protein [Burkholderia ubonensis]
MRISVASRPQYLEVIVFHWKSTLHRSNFTSLATLGIALMQVAPPAIAQFDHINMEPTSAAAQGGSLARPIVGDDPFLIRDTLENNNLTIVQSPLNIRKLNLIPSIRHKQDTSTQLAILKLDRDVIFVLPMSYGITYRSKKHLLTVNVDLASEDGQTGILLRKVTTGPSGRVLVVAPEAKSKGYIQHVDIVELKPTRDKKTMIHNHVTLSPEEFADTNGDFAIVLFVRLAKPYLTERNDHADPSNEEPTDITTRTSTLHAHIRAIWLVSPSSGAVLSRSLRLSR